MPQLTACPDCMVPCEPDDEYCEGCGARLAVLAPASSAAPRPPEQANHPGDGSGSTPDWAANPLPQPAVPAAPPAPPPAPQDAEPADRAVPTSAAGSAGQSVPGELGPPPSSLDRPSTAPAGDGADPREPAPIPPPAEGPWAGKVCVACATGTIDDDGYCEHCGHAQPRERDHMERELDGVAGVTDRGLRHHRNEDAFKISATTLPDGGPAVVAVVCDGVSSATRPDEASATAAAVASEALLDALETGAQPQQAMHDALLTAAEAVDALADGPSREHNAPACTCVSAIAASGSVTVGWVGDSRAYWVPDDRSDAKRLTEDDSWAARMVATGLMSESAAYADDRAHAITGWLGADAVQVEPHTACFRPDRPGVVVVCTDGLWNYAESAAQMAAAVPTDARTHPLRSAQHLVGLALDAGGHDNVTVAVLPFPPHPGRTPTAAATDPQHEAQRPGAGA